MAPRKQKTIPRAALEVGRKEVRRGASIGDRKQVRYPPGDGYIHQMPTWSLALIEMDGPFGWQACASEFIPEIIERLSSFETMRWREIEGPRHHWIQKDQLCPEAIAELGRTQLDDVDQVFSFALRGQPRIIGIIHNGVFKLIWWDPEHKFCPSPKKHT